MASMMGVTTHGMDVVRRAAPDSLVGMKGRGTDGVGRCFLDGRGRDSCYIPPF